MENLNDKEKAIYEFIIEVMRRDGYAPTVRDIKGALGIKSTSTVHGYLEKLEKKVYIQKESGKSRTLRVENVMLDSNRTVRVPILGQVTAGLPILAVENREGYIDFPIDSSLGKNNYYALRVKGESMIEVGILDGDIVIVEKTSYAENGQIVVALIDDEATVKTFYKENNAYRLQPQNSSMDPIIVDEVLILGKVIGSMRFYK